MTDHIELGKRGEQEAREHLIALGYTLRDTNWRCNKIELDIVAEKDGMLIIVEVKTRGTHYFGNPEWFVDRAKQKMIAEGAEAYIHQNKLDMPVRYDIVSVVIEEYHVAVMHIEDAFFPDNLGTFEACF